MPEKTTQQLQIPPQNTDAETSRRTAEIILTGDWDHSDFRNVVASWNYQVNPVDVEAIEEYLLTTSQQIDTIIVAASRPGQLSQQKIERIVSVAPLANICVLLGSWCEGETRTGEPWPGIHRIYWHEVINRTNDHQTLSSDACRDPGLNHVLEIARLPRTYSASDRFMDQLGGKPEQTVVEAPVYIVARERVSRETLTESVAELGYHAEAIAPDDAKSQRPGVWVVDLGHGISFDAELLETVASAAEDSSIFALASFPRRADWKRFCGAGVWQVISKPFELDTFATALNQALCAARLDRPVPHSDKK